MSHSNGRPEAEVIVNYGDGLAYSKYKMEEAFRTGGFLDKPPVKAAPKPKDPSIASLKREDIDLIVNEFEIPRPQAEKVLAENGGNVQNALRALEHRHVTPLADPSSSNAQRITPPQPASH